MTGREQYQVTARQALRADAAAVVVSKEVAESRDFELRLSKDNGATSILLPTVEGIEWSDTSDEGSVNSSPTISGAVTLRQPLENGKSTLPDIQPNDLFECLANGKTVWKMRAVQPAYSATDGTVTVELQDEMRQLALSRANFAYANKRPDEIATDVCNKFGIKRGSLLRMKILDSKTGQPSATSVVVHKLKQNSASPQGVIRTAYSDGQRLSGQRYVMRWNYLLDQLEVTAMQPGTIAYRFTESTITDAQIEVKSKGNFATSLQASWRIPMPKLKTNEAKKSWVKKHPRSKPIVVKADAAVVKRFGNISQYVEITAKNKSEALKKAKNDLAARIVPVKTLTFTTAGVAAVRRGDYIEVHLPNQGFDHRQLWVQSVSHSVSESYTMEVTARFDDPMNAKKIKAEAEAAARYRKAQAKKKKAAKTTSASGYAWHTVGATQDNYSGGAVACGDRYKNGGFSYAELGVDGDNAGMSTHGGFLADLFIASGELKSATGTGLPCGFKVQVRKIVGGKGVGKIYTLTKVDNGSGQPGNSHFKIDLEPGITAALGFTLNDSENIQVRRA